MSQFEIQFSTLRPGLHDFRFEIADSFFQEFNESEVQEGHGECLIKLDKKVNMLTVDFDINIIVTLICDRSLETFNCPITINKQLVVKFGDEEGELGEDILVIPWDSQEINLAHVIYEYITVAIPMKKIHPDYLKENEDEFGEIIYKSENDPTNEDIDPRWSALKKLN